MKLVPLQTTLTTTAPLPATIDKAAGSKASVTSNIKPFDPALQVGKEATVVEASFNVQVSATDPADEVQSPLIAGILAEPRVPEDRSLALPD